MKNYIQEGRMITVAAPTGGVTSGDGVLIGALFGVATKTAAAGETATIATTGVFDLPKLTSAVIAAGDKVSWDDTAKQVNVPGTGRYPIGTATEAAGDGATNVRVRLDGVATAAAG
jgi:predicted RecA/RadA family phage recombinase